MKARLVEPQDCPHQVKFMPPMTPSATIRRELAERHPWLPGAVFKAFEQAKDAGLRKLSDTSATKVTLPFFEERLKEARDLMGDDFRSCGVGPNRKVLDYFLAQHCAEGLSPGRVSVDELFHPATYETFKLGAVTSRRYAADNADAEGCESGIHDDDRGLWILAISKVRLRARSEQQSAVKPP